MHLGQPADHIVLGVAPFFSDVGLDISLKGFELFKLRIRLFPAQKVAMAFAINKGGDLSIAPFCQ